MASAIVVPEVGEISSEVTFVRWMKEEGEWVDEGEPVFELDTEKSLFEVEAFAAGYLADLQVTPGDAVGSQQVVAQLLTKEEWAERSHQVEGATEPASDAQEPSEPPAVAPGNVTIEPRASREGEVRASPRARRRAAEHGVDLGNVPGTGPDGLITERDVASALPGAAPDGPLSEGAADRRAKVRRAVNQRTEEAWRSIPHFTLRLDADATDALETAKPTPLVAGALARALTDHPECNVEWRGDEVVRRASVDLGILVDAPDGLLLARVAGASELQPDELADAIGAAAERARAGKLRASDFEARSATISNLGMHAVDGFVGIIPAPDCMLLTVGRSRVDARWVDGSWQPRRILPLGLSIDHRAIDGADGGRLLTSLERHLSGAGQRDD